MLWAPPQSEWPASLIVSRAWQAQDCKRLVGTFQPARTRLRCRRTLFEGGKVDVVFFGSFQVHPLALKPLNRALHPRFPPPCSRQRICSRARRMCLCAGGALNARRARWTFGVRVRSAWATHACTRSACAVRSLCRGLASELLLCGVQARWADFGGLFCCAARDRCMWRQRARACRTHGGALLLRHLVGPRSRCRPEDVCTLTCVREPSMPICMAQDSVSNVKFR